jgi:hypothetical protein
VAKFLFVYRNSAEQEMAPPTPEVMQAVLAAWSQWMEQVAKGGHLIDGGDGLQATGKVVKPGGIVSDGPFIESKDIVGGYSILRADSYEQAVEFARTCPALTHGGTVEIRELAGFN